MEMKDVMDGRETRAEEEKGEMKEMKENKEVWIRKRRACQGIGKK